MTSINLPLFRTIFGWQHDLAVDGKYADTNDRQVLNSLNAFRQPRRVLEIGINEGRTAELLLRTSPWIQHYCGIDVYPDFQPAWDHQRPEIPGPNKIAHLVSDNRLAIVMSNVGTYDGIQSLTGTDFDLIFIDADHTHAGVARDTAIALSVATPGACIVWHDYASDVPGVRQFLDERAIREPVIHVTGTRIAFQFLQPEVRSQKSVVRSQKFPPSDSCLLNPGSCPPPSDSCLLNPGSCPPPSDSCLLNPGSCPPPSDSCLLTSVSSPK
jgi:predicted O-methyltransferase YrrM